MTTRVTQSGPRTARHLVVLLSLANAWLPSGTEAQTVADACDDLAEIVAKVPKLELSATDTLVRDERFGRTTPGCQLRFVGRQSAFGESASPDALVRQSLAAAGWREDLRYAADGPDGTAFGFSRGDVLCLINAFWDGEDHYELTIGCTARAGPNGDGDA